MALPEQPGCLDPVEARHADVHQHDVGSVPLDQRQGLLAVRGAGEELDAVEEPEQHAEALADEALVIGEHDPDRSDPVLGVGAPGAHGGSRSSTRKPVPVGSATSSPPSSSARSRIPVRP